MIYGHELALNKTHVIITSNPVAAGAINESCKNLSAVTWGGEDIDAQQDDWSFLSGKQIVLWPNNTTRDITFMRIFAGHLAVDYKISTDKMRIIRYPDDAEYDYNAASALKELGSGEYFFKYVRENLVSITDSAPVESEKKQSETKPTHREFQDQFFRVLGYNHDEYFYLSYSKKQVVSMKASAHNINNFLQLAPMDFWEQTNGGLTGGKLSQAITNNLLAQSHAFGTFDEEKIRGIGAWFDDGKTVIHMGDCLKIDGEKIKIPEYEGSYIYELANHTEIFDDETTANVKEASDIMKVFNLLPLKNLSHQKLLAGWCVVAPICGILPWRPHVWLTGQAGVGKSYSVDNIVIPMIGSIALQVVSEASEAGIRQLLGKDARPVINDETEAENKSALEKLQNKILLARASSSESSATIVKGSANHKAVSFKVRSCFMFSSINVNLQMQSDISRFTVIDFNDKKKINPENFEQLKKNINKYLDKKNCSRVRARTIKMIPVIRENISVFAKVGAELFDSQRDADQYAAMLAGYCSLISDDVITEAAAAELIKAMQVGVEVEKEERNDSEKCLDAILQGEIRIEFEDMRKSRMLSIGELIGIANDPENDPQNFGGEMNSSISITCDEAQTFLRRCGIKTDIEFVYIANDHKKIREFLTNSPWENKWRPVLKRLSEDTESVSLTWPDKTRGRATKIPMSVISGELTDAVPF